MRAIACCPVRVDALAMYDASDAPRMESPTESKGSSIGVEEAASSSQADGSARLSEVEGQYGRLKGLIEHQMRNTKETEDALRAHTQLITREVCGWTKRYIDTKLAQQPRAIAGGSSREEGSASGAQ